MAQVGPPGIWKEDGPWKLYVSILSATNLPDPKNPYVKLNVSSQPSPQERQTRKVNGGKTPGWYQEFEFDLDNSQRHLSVAILDPRRIGSDAVVGEKAFPLGELVDGVERDEWLTLQRAGRLHLKILVSGPMAAENQKQSGSGVPSIGLQKKGPKHKFVEQKFKGAETCRGCKTPLKSKLFSKAYECTVCQYSCCLSCYQSQDLTLHYGCKTAEKKLDAQMSQNVMNFYLNYTGRDKNGVLIVHSLPQEWKQLFKSAGVKPRELKNPDTVIALLQAWDEHTASNPGGEPLAGIGGGEGGAAAPAEDSGQPVLCRAEAKYDYAAAQEGDLDVKAGDIISVHDKLPNGWWNGTCRGITGFFPGGFVEELPEAVAPPPNAAPPPPPPGPAPPSGGGVPPPPPGPAPSGGIPPPPPGGGPPPPPSGGPPPPGGGGLAGIAAGSAGLKKGGPPPPARSGSGGGGEGRGDLLAAIRQGKQLHHTDAPPPAAAPPPDSGNGASGGALLSVLSATIEKRREQLAAEGNQDDGEDGDWDDWD